MIESALLEHWWLGIALWSVAHWLDYFGTLYAAKRHREVMTRHIDFSGSIELTPEYQRDIDAARRFSPRAIVVWIVVGALLGVSWWIAIEIAHEPAIYLFWVGAFLITRACVIMGHAANVIMAGWIDKGNQCRGRIEHARSLVLRMAAMRFVNFGVLSAAGFLLRWDWFFAGGAFACAILGVKFAGLAKRAPDLAPIPAKANPVDVAS
jgi:hypothetical protein